MAIANKNDLSHIVRTTQQWTTSYDSYECIPEGVLCVEFTPDEHVKAKIGNGHDIFSKLPYIGGADLTNYYTKNETVKCIEDIIKAKRFICIKGILQNKDQLPSHADCGDLYFVISQNQSSSNKYDEYVYSPSNTWENLGSIPIDIDLSEYAKIVYVDEKIDEVNERIDDIEQHGTHTHTNKDILDLITAAFTAEEKDKLSTLYNYDDTELRELITQASHTHSNKDILDAISAPFTKEDKSKLDQLNPYDDSILKEKITALERLAHEHSNKRILDRTTASFTTEYERKMRWIRLYTGCTGMEEGIAGLVPAAQAGEEDYVLSGSGEWVPQTGGGGTYELPIATTSTLGGIKVGDGLEIDANGKLSVVGGGGSGDSIAEGDGITITTDPQTGVKTISVNTGDHLSVDSQTGELNVTGVDYEAGQGIRIGSNYNFLEYIKNSGNYDQIILTDILPKFSDALEVDVMFGAASGLDNNREFIGSCNYDGASTVGDPFFYGIYVFNDNIRTSNITFYNHFVWTPQCTNTNFIDNPYGIDYYGNNPVRQIARMQGNTGSWGNVSRDFSDQYRSDFVDPFYPMAIFGSNHNNSTLAPYICGEITLYGVKLYDSLGTLIHDLRPVERVSDNAAGLYDVLTNKFYGNAGGGSFVKGPVVTTPDRIINAKIGNGLQFDSNNAIEVNTGDGLQINQDGEVEIDPSIIPEVIDYEAGNGIEITEVTHEDEFRVQNQEYFFTDHGLTCIITGNYGPRTYTKINDGDIVAAVIGKTGGWYLPLFVGLTEDSVKYSNSYDSNILGPSGSFTYHDKTWYYTADYALTAGDGVDHAGHLQSITDTIYDGGAEGGIQAAKDLIDLAVLLPDVSIPTISAKIGAGLSFDANGAIQADAQPLSPATDSTLGGVIVGEGINVDEYGEISLSAGEGLDIDFESHIPSEYTLVKGISSVGHNDLPYINTGYLIKPTSRIVMRGVLYKTTDSWVFPIGVRHNNYSNPVMFCTHHNSNGDSIELWLPNDTLIASATDREKCYNDPVTVTISSDGLNIENETTGEVITLTTSDTLPTATLPLYVFATNDNYTISFPGPMDLYRLQIFEGTTKVLDYLPCKRNSDNKYGVYDIVANEYKASSNVALFEPVTGTPSGDDLIQQIKLLPATENTIGGVIVGDGILVDNDGTISVDPTIIPEVPTYEAGTAISIEEVEHGGVTFDAWDDGTGWENVCYSNSTGNSVTSYRYEAHSPISNSYTLPAGATHIRAIAYDQNDTMLWTSFSWIDSNNYHFASTSPEEGHYSDWFEIPTGAVKVNFGVRHSKLNTSQSMNLNDIKSVDITIQTVSEIEVDVWNGGSGWLNGNYYSGTSDIFTTSWPYSYHSNPDAYIPIPSGATHLMVMGISNENDSHFEGGGVNVFSAESHSNHIAWWGCAWEWHEISSDAKFVQIDVKWNDNNTRTISGSNIKSVTLAWKLPALETNTAINVKYGNGLTVNQNNELEVKLGDGLTFDEDGAIEVTGGSGGGDSIAEGEGITITTDSQTGVKTIGINVGDGLDIDPITNELFVNGQLPEGTIIKKLTYTGNGNGSSNVIKFTKKPVGILSINGSSGTNYISAISASINSEYLHGVYGGVSTNGVPCSCKMSYNDTTNELTFTQAYNGNNDAGLIYNANGKAYTMQYLVKGHAGSGTSVNNEVSVIKTITYTGTGTSTNAIQFPETPDFILSINGKDGVSGDMVVLPFDPLHPTSASQYTYTYTSNGTPAGGNNSVGHGHGTYAFDTTTNTLTLTAIDQGAACNYLNRVYYLRYVVNEVIASSENYSPGEAIDISPSGTDLPTGYADISYIESTGSQWTQLDYYANNNSRAVVDYVVPNTVSTTSDAAIFGSGHGSSQAFVFWDDQLASNQKGGFVYGSNSWSSSTDANSGRNFNKNRGEHTILDCSVNGCFIDNNLLHGVTPTGNFDSTIALGIFASASGDQRYGYNIAPFRIYSFKIYENNALMVDLRPALRLSDNKPGFYDIINDDFYPSITSTDFTYDSSSIDTHDDELINVKYNKGLTVNQNNELEVNIGTGLVFDPQTGAINVTGGGGGGGDTVAEGAGIEITTDQQTGNKVIAVNAGTGLQVDQTTNELEIDDSVVTEDDELNLVFVPDDYQPS